ncbi:Uncharacterised protein [Mycobacteroides abscessus subsp. abscessus]|nr:Uncharacterised protein [Mycobacteroides abscessus subsp. abscessus]
MTTFIIGAELSRWLAGDVTIDIEINYRVNHWYLHSLTVSSTSERIAAATGPAPSATATASIRPASYRLSAIGAPSGYALPV